MRSRLAAALLVALLAPAARADVVYSTFGPGDSYNARISVLVTQSASLGVGGARLSQDVAMAFTVVGGDYLFTSFQAAIARFRGTPVFELRVADGFGRGPGTLLETITLAQGTGVVTGAASGSVLLKEGFTYYLATNAVAGAFDGLWYQSGAPVRGQASGKQVDLASGDGSWFPAYTTDQSAFRINGDLAPRAVPEPAGLALGATATAALGLIGLRRRPSRGMPAAG